ncbi:MAG: acyl-CoA dehydrogenase family protein [Pseudomonadota bacterium]
MNIATPVKSFDTAHAVDFDAVDAVVGTDLASAVPTIDTEQYYPESVMRALGAAGSYGSHLAGRDAVCDLSAAILATSRASEVCLSTGFCMWCQNALGWYISSSESDWLKENVLPGVASGQILGGTGMSNPMKSIAGIEKLKLRGVRVDGGYRVKGSLPWISNLSDGGWFGTLFDVPDENKTVMGIFKADPETGVKLRLDHDFLAMGGTATQAVGFRDVFIPDEQIVGDPAGPFIKNIRGGFVLMQCGMGLGVMKSSINLIRKMEGPLGHVNQFLEKGADELQASYDALLDRVVALSKTPYDPSDAYWKQVLQARLDCGEGAVETAHYAMLHCGARGYITGAEAQRRLRESYFVAIVTPATKHLRKMIAAL